LISRSSRQIASNSAPAIGARIVIVHNHPSGDPTPSKANIEVTKDIKKAAAPLGLTLHDHLIIGRNSHTSLRDLKLI
jgi:DNA repair protein RadC